MKEASKFVHLKKIRRPRPEALAYSGVPRSGAAGFYGDPHFVIPLRQSNLNLCFNWDGEEGDVYNLIYDMKTGHAVNAMLTKKDDSGKTYVSEIGVLVPSMDMSLKVTNDFLFLHYLNRPPFPIPLTSGMQLEGNGIFLKLVDESRTSALLQIRCDGFIYQIRLRRYHFHPHLDFTIENYPRSDSFRGVIGQFLRNDIFFQKSASEINKGTIRIRKRSARVIRKVRHSPISMEAVECWHTYKNARQIMDGKRAQYKVAELLTKPVQYIERQKRRRRRRTNNAKAKKQLEIQRAREGSFVKHN